MTIIASYNTGVKPSYRQIRRLDSSIVSARRHRPFFGLVQSIFCGIVQGRRGDTRPATASGTLVLERSEDCDPML